jgi:hypothetical protein
MIPQPCIRWAPLAVAALVAGCAANAPAREPEHTAVLLVSLEDGSMIRQDIRLDADICMKVNGETATTCLTRTEPIMDADGHRVIGYRMRRTEIDLYSGDPAD